MFEKKGKREGKGKKGRGKNAHGEGKMKRFYQIGRRRESHKGQCLNPYIHTFPYFLILNS